MYISSPSSPSLKRTVPLVKCLRNLAKGIFSAAIALGERSLAEFGANGGSDRGRLARPAKGLGSS